jgi:urea carboxylase
MDDQSFRLGNRLLGNAEGTAGLEIAVSGPSLLFNAPARICLMGADFGATFDGVAVKRGVPLEIAEGQTLTLGRMTGGGMRGYVLFAGGLDVAAYLGSRSTFELGQFGGHAARRCWRAIRCIWAMPRRRRRCPPSACPNWVRNGRCACCMARMARPISSPRRTSTPSPAPNGRCITTATAPACVWSAQARMGALGRWRGGPAPSNIHDNPYAIGAVDFTGDMPIILGPDGPSLGGFVCPFVVIAADRWKIGQLKPGDRLSFVPVTIADAQAADAAKQALIASGAQPGATLRAPWVISPRSCKRLRKLRAAPAWSIASRATATFWSNMAISCSISSCASASMR